MRRPRVQVERCGGHARPHLPEATALCAGRLPVGSVGAQVAAYAAKLHAVVEEGAKNKRSAALTAFKAELAHAVALGLGAR